MNTGINYNNPRHIVYTTHANYRLHKRVVEYNELYNERFTVETVKNIIFKELISITDYLEHPIKFRKIYQQNCLIKFVVRDRDEDTSKRLIVTVALKRMKPERAQSKSIRNNRHIKGLVQEVEHQRNKAYKQKKRNLIEDDEDLDEYLLNKKYT